MSQAGKKSWQGITKAARVAHMKAVRGFRVENEGRPRKADRCPCGAMTLKRAVTRVHLNADGSCREVKPTIPLEEYRAMLKARRKPLYGSVMALLDDGSPRGLAAIYAGLPGIDHQRIREALWWLKKWGLVEHPAREVWRKIG